MNMADLIAAQKFSIGSSGVHWNMSLATYLDGRARLALESDNSERTRMHAASLRGIASALRTVGCDDALALLGNAVWDLIGQRPGAQYNAKPGGHAYKSFIHAGATGSATPWTEYVLAFFAGAVMDSRERYAKLESEAHRARLERDAAVSTSESATVAREREAQARQLAEAEVNRLVAERDELAKRAEWLRHQLPTDAPAPEATVQSGQSADDAPDFPTAEQLEAALDTRRVAVAPGVALERHKHGGVSDTWYCARIGNQVHWLGSATDGSMTIPQAVAAKARLSTSKTKAGK
jgi:hypothetical protein